MTVTITKKRPISTCSVDGCQKPVGQTGGKGFCRKHYRRFRAYGAPLGGGISYGEANKFVRETACRIEVDYCIFWSFGKNSVGRG